MSGPVSDAEIRRRFPVACERFIQALHDARAISAAAQRARELQEAPANQTDAPACEEDFSLLQQALPSFEFLQLVGTGGQGAVYKAVQKSTHRTIALKILLGSRLSSSNHTHRFSREVEIASQLQHENIVRVFESGFVLGRPYFAMEFVDGMPIDDYILLQRPSVEDRVKLFAQVCRAVSHAHQRGVIHRDLKSANILVDFDGKPHVLDFGLAKCFDGTLGVNTDLNVSLPGQVVGTLPYLSPEQALGPPEEVDTRSDVYSLGVILYQILTGSMPYALGGTPDSLRERIARDDPMSFRKALSAAELPPYDSGAILPDDLEQIVRQALAKDKDRRYQSADALADDLDRFLAGRPVNAKADSALYVLRKTVRRYRVQFAVAGAFLLLLVIGLAGMYFMWRRADRLAHTYLSGLEMGSYLRLASVGRDEGRLQDAVEMFRKAIEIADMIPAPDNKILQMTSDAQQRLGELSLGMNDMDSAREHIRKALDLDLREAAANPQDMEWRCSLGAAYRLRGKLESSEGKYSDALKSFQESRKIRESLVKENPSNVNLKIELADVYRVLGTCCRKLKKQQESGQYYRLAVNTHQQLFDQDRQSLARSLDLGIAESGLATWYMVQEGHQRDNEARALLEKVEARLGKYEDSEAGASRVWDIYRTLKAVRQNLAIIQRRSQKPRESTTTSSDNG